MPKSVKGSSNSIPHISLVQHGHYSSDEPIAQADVVEEFMHDDALELMDHFKDAYQKVCTKVRRPNVLMVGFSGAGKSSIINTVFGGDLAKEGAGKPITQHFQRYCPADQNIVIYDSKGLEAGMAWEELKASTEDFLESLNNSSGEEESPNVRIKHASPSRSSSSLDDVTNPNKLHLIWYVVNSAAARFQDFEERVCKELFPGTKIIFLLNKADISTKEQRDTMRQLILDMQLSQCIGIFETTSQRYAGIRSIDTCPSCGAQDLIIHRRTKYALCEECDHKEHLQCTTGLSDVIALTISTLPKIARESFIAAQKVSLRIKERRAKHVITDFYDEQSHCFTQAQLLQSIAKMLTRLSILWDFRAHGHLYGTHIARDLLSSFSVRDKIFLFVHKNKHQKLRATAIGIIWNRCVRKLFQEVFMETIKDYTKEELDNMWPTLLETAFADLSEETVNLLEEELEEMGLIKVLRAEMPPNEEDENREHKKVRRKSSFGDESESEEGSEHKRKKKKSSRSHSNLKVGHHSSHRRGASESDSARKKHKKKREKERAKRKLSEQAPQPVLIH
mmetsp:Transcript_1579/g.5565  ORF Transcript_1579/g.5565 Transcript_1579/m.5565 type:complete len:563 (-) Transcript_1579:70-1758(-)